MVWQGAGILVATQKRVAFFVDKGLKVEFSLDKIIRIQYEDARFLLGTLTIFASDHKAIIENGLGPTCGHSPRVSARQRLSAVTSEAKKLSELKELGSTPEQTDYSDAGPTTTGSRRRTA